MSTALFAFLEKHRVGDTEERPTHVGLSGDYKGAYVIHRDDETTFHKLYCDAITQGLFVGLAELPARFSVFVMDIDLPLQEEKRAYTTEALLAFASCLQSILSEVFMTAHKPSIFIQEKHEPGSKRDGIHFIVPDIVSTGLVAREVRKQILDKHIDLVESLGTDDPESALDSGAFTNAWMMYGSSKSVELCPYLVTHVMKADETIPVSGLRATARALDADFKGSREEAIVLLLQEFSRRKVAIPSNVKITLKHELKQIKHDRPSPTPRDASLAKALLSCLRSDRADTYDSWLRVGFVLHYVDPDTMLPEWESFSRLSPKYMEGECSKLWSTFGRNPACVTMGTLVMMASEDDPNGTKKALYNHRIPYSSELDESDLLELLPGDPGKPEIVEDTILESYMKCLSVSRANIPEEREKVGNLLRVLGAPLSIIEEWYELGKAKYTGHNTTQMTELTAAYRCALKALRAMAAEDDPDALSRSDASKMNAKKDEKYFELLAKAKNTGYTDDITALVVHLTKNRFAHRYSHWFLQEENQWKLSNMDPVNWVLKGHAGKDPKLVLKNMGGFLKEQVEAKVTKSFLVRR